MAVRQHGSSPEGQVSEQFANTQQEHSDPERRLIQCGCDSDDKGGHGDEQEDGQHLFFSHPLSFFYVMTII
jgi:hypothetical protein